LISNTNILKVIWKRKSSLFVVSLLAIVLSTIFSGPKFITPKYESVAIVYPSNIEPFSEESPTEQMLQILNSTDIKQDLIDSFNLLEHYNIDTSKKYYHTKVMREIDNNLIIQKTRYESVIIEVRDKDREMACDMVKSTIFFFDKKMQNIFEINKREELSGINKIVKEKKDYIDSLNNRLDSLRKNYHILDYSAQSKEYTRQYLRSTSEGKNNSGVKNMETFFSSLESYGGEFLLLGGYLNSATGVYNKLISERDLIMKDLNKGMSFVNIINKPMPADKKCYPVRWIMVLGSFLATFLLTLIIFLFLD
jgi:capsular polysaccharide biosynthesis protein